MWILPETPIWLAEKDRLDEALASLAWLRNNEVKILTSQSVLYVIDNNQETGEEVKELEEKCQGRTSNSSFREKLLAKIRVLKSRSFWKPFMLAEPLNILYACSGTSILQFYIVTIFEESGSSVDSVQVFKDSIKNTLKFIITVQASLVVSAWRLFISFLSSVALLKLPRRPLFLSTTLLVCLSMASLGVFSYFQVRLKIKKL